MNIKKIEKSFRQTEDRKCSTAENGMVSTAFPEATEAGIEILKCGGNAVDAACAAAMALGVCEPQASGIGGQSMAIIHINGKTICIDGSSRAPSLAHIEKFEKGERTYGYKAATLPSTVAVLGYLNFRYGRLEWKDILKPAIKIAKNGYRITKLQQKLQERELENFFKVPSLSGARYFLKDGKKPYKEGDLFVQDDLAELLRYLAKRGPGEFYRGDIAGKIDRDMKKNGGFVRRDDLALIPWPIERKPLKRKYRDIRIFTSPPPAAGRTLLLVLMMLNNLPSKFIRDNSKESYHFIAETFRKAFLQRTQRPFDPNYYPQIADKIMLSRKYAKELSETIRDTIDPNIPFVAPFEDGTETTHLSVMDSDCNTVGITQSIERVFGSKAAAEGLGFLYNNYMLDYEVNMPSHPYYLRPNAIPWTTVAPFIAFYKKEPWIVAGSPGSERIYSSISQFLINIVDSGCSLAEAMMKPRMHCSINGEIFLESGIYNSAVIRYLEKMGYKIIRKDAFYFGAIHAVAKCKSGKGFQAVAEIRRDGISEGI